MLVDELELVLRAGDGGEGKVSFGKGKKSGPDGGNGGDGGNLYINAVSDLTLLANYAPLHKLEAPDGKPGSKDKCAGKKGDDLVINMPVGTLIRDKKTGEVFELTEVGENILICKGGKGGIGNFDLRSARLVAPKHTIPATAGQVRKCEIQLRFIADFGLIGLPSVGKSSLLNELTNAKAKTAEYHFTTLSPNLGVLPNKKIIADIPGLIKGASEGKGLGVKFLKHIQKVSLLLHCISADSPTPMEDYETIRKELGKFDEKLLEKKEMIIVTKSDNVSAKELKDLVSKLKKLKLKTVITSIHDKDSLDKLIDVLR